jgi:hypothetical protein
MRVAICISGGLRSFKLCYKNLNEHFSKLGNVDYFISTWDKPCYTAVSRYVDIHAINGECIYPDLLKPDEFVTEEYLRSFIDFRYVEIEPMSKMQELIDVFQYSTWSIMSPSRLMCQYYKLYRCNLLRLRHEQEHNIKYDIVIRVRPDITISSLPINIDPNKIYINDMVYIDYKTDIFDSINEMIYISNGENMDKICNIYNNFDKLWNLDDGYGERMSKKNFEMEGLLDKCVLHPFGITVERENGNSEFILSI